MVIQFIADAIDCTAASQNKIFDIRIQSVRDGRFDRIVTLASVLNDRICSVIDDKQIISRTTDQGVGTCAAIEHVISCTAHQNIIGAVSYQYVVKLIAGTFDCVCAGKRQIFEICALRIADVGTYSVDSFARIFKNRISGIIDDINIIACSAYHVVRIGTAIQQLLSGTDVQTVVSTAAGKHIVAIRSEQGIVTAAAGNGIVSTTGIQLFVTVAAVDQIIAAGAEYHIVATLAEQSIIAVSADNQIVAQAAVNYVIA